MHLGYRCVSCFSLSAQYLPYYSFISATPPIKNCILKLNSYSKCSATSTIRCTPFCFVILPMKDNIGISFLSSVVPKYFYCSSFFDSLWLPGVLLFMKLTRSSFLTPLGKENGFGYLWRTWLRGEFFNKSNLYSLETVPQLSQVYNAHLEGLIINLLLRYSTYH